MTLLAAGGAVLGLAASGETQAAIRAFESALAIRDDVGAIHYALLTEYAKLGRAEDAARHRALFERYQSHTLDHIDPIHGAISAVHRGDAPLYIRGRELAAEGRFEEARIALSDAIAINPASSTAYALLIEVDRRLGRSELSEEHYQLGVAHAPKSAELHFAWAQTLLDLARFEESETAFRRGLEIEPDHAMRTAQLGHAIEAQGRLAEAREHYQQAIERDPSNLNARYLLAMSCARQGRYSEALDQLAKTLEPQDSRTPLFLRAIASVHRRSGDCAQALDALRQALQLCLTYGDDLQAALVEHEIHNLNARQPSLAAAD